ncbi:MAG: AAA family ATPase [Pseudoflavonifractor sp.]|nr:AAA family ATPase [Alloprevotella sp.]MCM1116627.1 AAA family ATPase [Pseudoflavonifractor sp.]
MKFIRLEILNLASLDREGGEVIDFTEGILGQVNIFSIVGPTGSGKSTILDAICLALYGLTPRYTRRKGERKSSYKVFATGDESSPNDIGEHDARNILTRGRKHGYSKLTFQGPDGLIYRAEWNVTFRVRCYDRPRQSLYRITIKEGVTIEEELPHEKLQEIVGLDFDRFQRTVIIAQGAFAGFLNSKAEERMDLLERIVGTGDKYKLIGEAANNRYRDAQRNLEEINMRIDVAREKILETKDLEELDATIARLEAEAKKRSARLEALVNEIKWYDADDKMIGDIEAREREFSAATDALERMAEVKEQLRLRDATEEGRQTLRTVRKTAQDIAAMEKSLKVHEAQVEAQQTAMNVEQQTLAALSEQSAEAIAESNRMKPLIDKAREMKALVKAAVTTLDNAKSQRDKAKTSVDNASTAVDRNEIAITKGREAVAKAKKEHETHVKSTTDVTLRLGQDVAEAEAKEKALDEQLQKLSLTDLQETLTRATTLKADIDEALRIYSLLTKAKAEEAEHRAEMERLSSEIKTIKGELSNLNVAQEEEGLKALQTTLTLMASEDWVARRQSLTEGEPCPLCGSSSHPYASDCSYTPAVNEISLRIIHMEEELEAHKAKRNELEQKVNKRDGEIVATGKLLNKIQNEKSIQNEKWDTLVKRRPELTLDQEQLETKKLMAKGKTEDAAKAIGDYTAIDEQHKAANKRMNEAVAALNRHKEIAEKRSSELLARVVEENKAVARAEGQSEPLGKSLQEARERLLQAEEELSRVQKTHDEYAASLQITLGGADPDDMDKRLADSKNRADEAVKRSSDKIGQLKALLAREKGLVEQTATMIAELHSQLQQHKDQLRQWMESYDPEERMTEQRLSEIEGLTGDWQQLRETLREREMAVNSAITARNMALSSRAEHAKDKPEMAREELVKEREELRQISDEPLREARMRRQAHDEATKKIQEAAPDLEEIKRNVDDLKKIDAAVGSGGKLLRMIAQCYTLRFLVDKANEEIRKFTQRYELTQVKNSLAIKVIDHNLGGVERDTTSLSGGETFLVSLGLALGLAALSSCNVSSFDNLFIDEGFGSLDGDTLSLVIEALSSQQAVVGKKVCVISHTDIMAERIHTHIRLVRAGARSGSSRIQIETH